MSKKENIINGIKLFIMLYTMFMGFWTLFGIHWVKFGLPMTWWAALLLAVLAGAVEFAYCKWIMED